MIYGRKRTIIILLLCNLPEKEKIFPEKEHIERFQEKEKTQSTQPSTKKDPTLHAVALRI